MILRILITFAGAACVPENSKNHNNNQSSMNVHFISFNP